VVTRKKTSKQITEKLKLKKLKTELTIAKDQMKQGKNPLYFLMGNLDKLSHAQTLLINGALAYLSLNAFGKTVTTEEYTVKVPHHYKKEQFPVEETGYKNIGSLELSPLPLSPELRARGISPTGTHEVSEGVWYSTETRTRKKTNYNFATLLIGPVALQLAKARNLVAGTAGVSVLATMGVINAFPSTFEGIGELVQQAQKEVGLAGDLFGMSVEQLGRVLGFG